MYANIMQLHDFTYTLPEELIALHPPAERGSSRLLCLDATTGAIAHRQFQDLLGFLRSDDLLVFNDTRVIPARLFGRKQSGGAVEILIERVIEDNRVVCQLRASKSPKPGQTIVFRPKHADASAAIMQMEQLQAQVLGREAEFFVLQFPQSLDLQAALAAYGHIPLPPYIKREDQQEDEARYQTVYARHAGAVAAPTAGLHFDEVMLQAIRNKGIECAFLTLHVGAGTFQPVRVDDIHNHKMHAERIVVSEQVCAQVNACKQRGGRVIAVGTTSVRSLESAAVNRTLRPFTGETDIFIYPGFEFQIVDAMVTNFHLPESTLLMLVSAFASKEMLLGAYHKAIEQKYRFFSYGDAMLLYRSGLIRGN